MHRYQMITINREDMLELTRRMNLSRNCFDRIAGAYLDEEGYVEGTFNTHFLKLSEKDKMSTLKIAKAIPFAKPNEQLKAYLVRRDKSLRPGDVNTSMEGICGEVLQGKEMCQGNGNSNMRRVFQTLLKMDLKNDALLDVLYETIGEQFQLPYPYAVYFFHGNYDIIQKAKDKQRLGESEEVYSFLICAICPVHGDYEVSEPECGFLYPAFIDRSAEENAIEIYQKNSEMPIRKLESFILDNM